MKASIRGGFAELHPTSVVIDSKTPGENSHLNNAIVCTYIQHLPSKLMRQMRNRIQMLILVPQRLTGRQPARMIIRTRLPALRLLPRIIRLLHFLQLRRVRRGHLPVMRHQIFEILRPQDRNLRQQQLPLHERRGRVVEHGPHGHQVLELAARLLHHAVLAGQHDGHAGQVFHFRVADDQTVDVEAPCGQDAGDAG